MSDLTTTIASIESSLSITDELSGLVLRPSPERIRRELKRRGVTHAYRPFGRWFSWRI